MKQARQHKAHKDDKGKRLGWSAFSKDTYGTSETPKEVRGKKLTETEVKSRQKHSGGRTLVP
jgi:hypothetical protein